MKTPIDLVANSAKPTTARVENTGIRSLFKVAGLPVQPAPAPLSDAEIERQFFQLVEDGHNAAVSYLAAADDADARAAAVKSGLDAHFAMGDFYREHQLALQRIARTHFPRGS